MVSSLTLGSLVLGIVAWILPILNLVHYKRNNSTRWMYFSIISLSACASSLFFQIAYSAYLIGRNDVSALMDTMSTINTVSAILLLVTILLNTVTLIVYRPSLKK